MDENFLKHVKVYEKTGVIFISLIALILGLIFTNLGVNNVIFAILFPTSTSLWQMGKLLFTSTLIYAVIEYFVIGKHVPNFWFAKLASLLTGPLLFIGLSFIVDFAFNINSTTLHTIFFLLSTVIAQYLSFYIIDSRLYFRVMNAFGVVGALAILSIFTLYTFDRSLKSPIFEPMNSYSESIRNLHRTLR